MAAGGKVISKEGQDCANHVTIHPCLCHGNGNANFFLFLLYVNVYNSLGIQSMLDNTFEIIFLIGFIMGATIRGIMLARVPRWWRKKEKTANDQGNWLDKALMFPVFLGMQVIPFIYILSSWLNFADYSFPSWAGLPSGIVGTLVFGSALWLLWRSHADLGQSFSPELKTKEEHTLVTDGVYHYIRHPMYAAHLLWAIAQILLLQNWIAGWAFLVTMLPMYLLRAPDEERMMVEHFGEEYRGYMNRTGRLIPRLKK